MKLIVVVLLLAERPGVLHVEHAGPPDVGALQEQPREAVQAQAGGEGADQTVQAAQEHAQGPAHEQQDQQPDQGPHARRHVRHLGALRLRVLLRLRWRGRELLLGQTGKCRAQGLHGPEDEKWQMSV